MPRPTSLPALSEAASFQRRRRQPNKDSEVIQKIRHRFVEMVKRDGCGRAVLPGSYPTASAAIAAYIDTYSASAAALLKEWCDLQTQAGICPPSDDLLRLIKKLAANLRNYGDNTVVNRVLHWRRDNKGKCRDYIFLEDSHTANVTTITAQKQHTQKKLQLALRKQEYKIKDEEYDSNHYQPILMSVPSTAPRPVFCEAELPHSSSFPRFISFSSDFSLMSVTCHPGVFVPVPAPPPESSVATTLCTGFCSACACSNCNECPMLMTAPTTASCHMGLCLSPLSSYSSSDAFSSSSSPSDPSDDSCDTSHSWFGYDLEQDYP